MPGTDHNPHNRRLHIPLVPSSVGCAQVQRAPRPEWLKIRARTGPNYAELKNIMRTQELHTVCEEAACPNIFECWEDKEATFLVLGDRCTRRCGFCDVMTAKPDPVDELEPRRISDAVVSMGLRYVVLTGVARDDLPDGGARIWAECIRTLRESVPGCGIEILPTDFRGNERSIATVIKAEPDVFAHNLETVRRLHPRIRPAFDYSRSLETLMVAKRVRPVQPTKSNMILGMGERPEEVEESMRDLIQSGCDMLTIGQYLQPSAMHLPVDRWVTPEEFKEHETTGRSLGFAHVESGPLVRSSYRAGRQFRAAMEKLEAAG
ncbi:MAG: lipoyl synthase [Actinomycetota bacterium]